MNQSELYEKYASSLEKAGIPSHNNIGFGFAPDWTKMQATSLSEHINSPTNKPIRTCIIYIIYIIIVVNVN